VELSHRLIVMFMCYNKGTISDLSSAVWMANYETLDRCIADQIVIDAVASRVGKVRESVTFYLCYVYIVK